MYDEKELADIQNTLLRKDILSKTQVSMLKKEFMNKELPSQIQPFIRLFATHPDLYNKISNDKKVMDFSYFGFFPETHNLVYGSETTPTLTLEQGTRGIVGIVKNPEKNVVVKPIQTTWEASIANIADELNVGPKQYDSLKGFLSEEFIEGPTFAQLNENNMSNDEAYTLGTRIGEILSKLHSKNIYFNDTTLADDFGRSHLIVPTQSPSKLFDYGVAIELKDLKKLSDEEVYTYARTLPMIKMGEEMNYSEEFAEKVVADYRPILAAGTKEEILSRDINFIHEGLHFASYRIGNKITSAVSKGFEERYDK